jgi:hypothetical protein
VIGKEKEGARGSCVSWAFRGRSGTQVEDMVQQEQMW